MKITRVQSFLLSYPFEKPLHLHYYGGDRTITKRDAMLIRIDTDKGLVGWAPGQASDRAKHIVDTVVAPFLVGRSLADADALRVLFMKGPGLELPAAKVYCSVEIGLYDLIGKAKGAPVSEFLGGRLRDRIRLYGSAGMYMSPESYAEEAAAIADLGFRAYKMRPALGPEEDTRTVRLMREATGPAFDLMVDAHTWWRMGDKSYDAATVQRLARELAEYDIAWLEEPLPPDDHEALRELKELDVVPIASGEHEPNDDRFLDLIQENCVDYVQMDIICQGGYTTARRIMPEIAKGGLRFAFHSWGTALEVVAAAHLGICWPETVVEWLEYPCYSSEIQAGMYPFPLASDMLKEPLTLDQGDLVVSVAPGLGVEINESVIERYPWIPGPWSTFTLHSPHETWAVTGDHSVRWADR
jgi:L-alanine-DL-glutamate epimerase-like enolase superfamily enzyme